MFEICFNEIDCKKFSNFFSMDKIDCKKIWRFFRKIRKIIFVKNKWVAGGGGGGFNNFSRKIRHDLLLGFDVKT